MFFRKPAIYVAVLFLSLAAAHAQSNPARSEIIFPFFVRTVRPPSSGCECWGTYFEVLNPHSSSTTVQLTLIDSSATVRATVSDSVLANRIKFVSFGDATSGNTVGWVRISASQPVIVRQTIAHVSYGPSQIFPTVNIFPLSDIVKNPPLPTRREVIKVEYNGDFRTNTGIAVAFPAQDGGAPVRAKLVLRWIDARIIAERELTIAANGQIVGFITELLPASLSFSTFDVVSGTLEMTFDRDVFVTAIQFTSRGSGTPEKMEEPLAGTVPFLIPAP